MLNFIEKVDTLLAGYNGLNSALKIVFPPLIGEALESYHQARVKDPYEVLNACCMHNYDYLPLPERFSFLLDFFKTEEFAACRKAFAPNKPNKSVFKTLRDGTVALTRTPHRFHQPKESNLVGWTEKRNDIPTTS